MSIQGEITRIANNVQATIDVIGQTGVSVPAGANSDNLPSLAQALAGEKQDKLTGTQEQLVGFNASGDAAPVPKPTASDIGAIPFPEGGAEGQVLTKTSDGVAWGDPAGGSRPKAIPIPIPVTGWTNNQQTFAVTGIPADPTTYEVHLSQTGEANVKAAMTCGIYIVGEAENSLTLEVVNVPETAFEVYAVVQGVTA